jgi:hypothetical protein
VGVCVWHVGSLAPDPGAFCGQPAVALAPKDASHGRFWSTAVCGDVDDTAAAAAVHLVPPQILLGAEESVHDRKIPEWGKSIFSSQCVCIRPSEPEELAGFMKYAVALTRAHLMVGFTRTDPGRGGVTSGDDAVLWVSWGATKCSRKLGMCT